MSHIYTIWLIIYDSSKVRILTVWPGQLLSSTLYWLPSLFQSVVCRKTLLIPAAKTVRYRSMLDRFFPTWGTFSGWKFEFFNTLKISSLYWTLLQALTVTFVWLLMLPGQFTTHSPVSALYFNKLKTNVLVGKFTIFQICVLIRLSSVNDKLWWPFKFWAIPQWRKIVVMQRDPTLAKSKHSKLSCTVFVRTKPMFTYQQLSLLTIWLMLWYRSKASIEIRKTDSSMNNVLIPWFEWQITAPSLNSLRESWWSFIGPWNRNIRSAMAKFAM